MSKYSIHFVDSDEFGIVPGSGWVIKQNGKRIDWPMCFSREEAEAELAGFKRELLQLASDEASERFA